MATTMSKEYELSGWDLSELLAEPSDAVIQSKLAEIDAVVKAFMAQREQLQPDMDPEHFLDVVEQYEALTEVMYNPVAYASLWFSADTQSTDALTFQNRMQQLMTEVQNKILFFSLWWKELDDDAAARLLDAAGANPDYRHFLEDLRRTKPYTLDERSEQIINTKDADGIGGLITIYSMLTNRLEFKLEVDGETKTLTRDALMSYVQGPRADLRAAAYQELYRVYANEAKILAQIYANRVRDWFNENIELRSFSSPINVRNVANDIPDAAVDALLDVARRNVGVFQRYFKLKAGWLGMDKLRRYDIYAPLATSDHTIEYGDGVNMAVSYTH